MTLLAEAALAEPNAAKVVVRYRDAAHCIAWIGNVELILSREAPSSAVMRTIIAELDALSKSCGCKTGAMVVINADCPPPDEAARNYIRTELARSSMVAAAQVVEGTGFRGAAMRAVLSMLQLTLKARYRMLIASNVDEAALWLSDELNSRVGRAPSASRIVNACRELRRDG
ncbi:MAG TPA: hypothetical protein VHM70_00320 [Polyangiaceae bacterium]|jgi:hypothetical protein|nr:hypothetical protein [Polyangiaceae bacterium]